MRSFTVREFHDFIKILEEHPEWREEMRRLILTDELLKLPELVRELVEAQRRTERRVDALAEAQRRTEERLENLAARVDALAEAQRKTEERLENLAARVDALAARVDALAEAQRRTEEELRSLAAQVDLLAESQRKMQIDLSDLKGDSIERKYRERAFAYFNRLVRRAHTLSPDEIVELVNRGVEKGIISEREAEELLWADVIVRGRGRERGEEVYLVVEVSWGVGIGDVERAASRTEILRKLGFNVIGVVAGKEIMPEAGDLAKERGVYRVVDGYLMD